MDEIPSRANLKRPVPEDDDSNKQSAPKRVRFPKGKKVKQVNQVVEVQQGPEEGPTDLKDPRNAAKERAMQRNQIAAELFTEENRGMSHDISTAEVQYEDDENFIDDGIQIEPFNLTKEREEGYFDAQGNFIEYVNDNEIKDAWLDSVDFDSNIAQRGPAVTINEADAQDLTPQVVGKMKRRIADALEPGETVLRALRRLKGNSNNKKEKMTPETKVIFDQLTEDAMKLMENGDYNVYDEKQEVFQREAEGYEKLAQAKGEGTSTSSNHIKEAESSMAAAADPMSVDPSYLNGLAAEKSTDDTFDMFGDDDETAAAAAAANPTSQSDLVSNSDAFSLTPEGGSLQNDYVYDDTSGYYYSSSLGYYYDPSTGLYCHAASAQWYSYDEQNGTYVAVQEAATTGGGLS